MMTLLRNMGLKNLKDDVEVLFWLKPNLNMQLTILQLKQEAIQGAL